MTILDEIVAHKRQEVEAQKAMIDEEVLLAHLYSLYDSPRQFMHQMRRFQNLGRPAVIAEIKKASPSAGVIREDFDVPSLAKSYAAGGACCLSVLTDKHFFQGSPLYLQQAREAVPLPILRKDFIIDRYQVLESRVLGTDCILLIAAILSDDQLREYTQLAQDLGMDVLVEVHDEAEFERAVQLPILAIGVNNRNLHDFSVSLDTSLRLQEKLPPDMFLISESGIAAKEDVARLQATDIHAFLIGGSLMKEENPGQALRHLISA